MKVVSKKENIVNKLASFFGLFTSVGTLLCCALPALLVSLGLGATMLSLTSAVPQIIWISENKIYVFTIAFTLLILNSVWVYHNRNAPCPIDPKLRDACISGRRFSKYVLILSWICLIIGFFFAYIAQYIFLPTN